MLSPRKRHIPVWSKYSNAYSPLLVTDFNLVGFFLFRILKRCIFRNLKKILIRTPIMNEIISIINGNFPVGMIEIDAENGANKTLWRQTYSFYLDGAISTLVHQPDASWNWSIRYRRKIARAISNALSQTAEEKISRTRQLLRVEQFKEELIQRQWSPDNPYLYIYQYVD